MATRVVERAPQQATAAEPKLGAASQASPSPSSTAAEDEQPLSLLTEHEMEAVSQGLSAAAFLLDLVYKRTGIREYGDALAKVRAGEASVAEARKRS